MTVSSTSQTSSSASTASSSSASTNALTSLSSNFNDFLSLLMTQLQNQDPTSPTDTNQFTSELVEFSSVEQQITTNSSLTQLIQATQSSNILQSASLIGKQVQVTSDHVALQNGQGSLQFTTTSPQAVSIGIYSDGGVEVRDATVASTTGTNTWTWDGLDAAGNQLPDGSYKAVVTDASGNSVAYTVNGTVTGMQRSGDTVNVELGSLQTSLSNVQSIN